MEGKKILVTGSVGQIGSEFVPALRSKYGRDNVIAAGHSTQPPDFLKDGPFIILDVTNKLHLIEVIQKHQINVIYHLASLLSAVSEQKPDISWEVNINGLKNVLDVARDFHLSVFWPSSIAVFGPSAPKYNTPQHTILEPSFMYGVTKVSGELLCNYYHKKWNLDVRGLRYPGIISSMTLPGGGTTDYAVGIFYDAVREVEYKCYLRHDSFLPMMYMPDAIDSAISLMESQTAKKGICYNITAWSFCPKQLAEEISKRIPEFEISYEVDPARQSIADSWPDSINDSEAQKDWNWTPKYSLQQMVADMLKKLKERVQ